MIRIRIMYSAVLPKIESMELCFHKCRPTHEASEINAGSPHGCCWTCTSLRQYITRIAIIMGGMYFSINLIMRGGSLRENSTNEKALVQRMTKAATSVPHIASVRERAVLISAPPLYHCCPSE